MAPKLELNPFRSYPRTQTLETIWKGIVTGTSTKRSPQEVERIVSRIWQPSPLTPLSHEENTTLRHYYVQYVDRPLQNQRFEQFVKPIVYFPKNSEIPNLISHRIHIYKPCILIDDAAHIAMKYGYKPLSQKGKMSLLANPQLSHEIMVTRVGITDHGINGWGIRPFFNTIDNESYGYTVPQFLKIVESVSRRIKRNVLTILDVGGGNGLAMHDLLKKQHEGRLGKYKFQPIVSTAEEQLAMWPESKYIIGPAERLPRSLKESVAIAVSNRAFEYFVFPDIALKNVVSALIPGGFMRVDFAYEDSPLRFGNLTGETSSYVLGVSYNGPTVENRVRAVYRWLHKMEEKGYIKIAELHDGEHTTMPKWGPIELVKLRSIPDKEFITA